MLTTLGKRVKTLRTANNMTQEEFGSYIGVSAAQVAAIEHGRRNPSVKTLSNIAETFDTSIDYLVSGDDTE